MDLITPTVLFFTLGGCLGALTVVFATAVFTVNKRA